MNPCRDFFKEVKRQELKQTQNCRIKWKTGFKQATLANIEKIIVFRIQTEGMIHNRRCKANKLSRRNNHAEFKLLKYDLLSVQGYGYTINIFNFRRVLNRLKPFESYFILNKLYENVSFINFT